MHVARAGDIDRDEFMSHFVAEFKEEDAQHTRRVSEMLMRHSNGTNGANGAAGSAAGSGSGGGGGGGGGANGGGGAGDRDGGTGIMMVKLACTLQCEYFNPVAACTEPIIEPFKVQACVLPMQRNSYGLWVYSHDRDMATAGAGAVEAVSKATLIVDDPLQINLTPKVVQTLCSLGALMEEEKQQADDPTTKDKGEGKRSNGKVSGVVETGGMVASFQDVTELSEDEEDDEEEEEEKMEEKVDSDDEAGAGAGVGGGIYDEPDGQADEKNGLFWLQNDTGQVVSHSFSTNSNTKL
jgi:hypothetical protein